MSPRNGNPLAGTGGRLAALREREQEAKRLRSIADRLRRYADRVDLAATYWEDGAHGTARLILTRGGGYRRQRSVVSLVLAVVRYLNGELWCRENRSKQ